MAEAFRAFVAVHVGRRPGLASLLDGLAATDADLKLVDPENLHVTLKFIGTLDAARVPEVEAAMRAAAADAKPFTAALEGVGSFGRRDAPRVVFVNMRDDAGTLKGVTATLDAALAAAGVAEPESRAFKPHLTLARSRSPRGGDRVAAFVQTHAHAHAGDVDVTHVTLMRSDLGPRGPTYTEVARVPLGGG